MLDFLRDLFADPALRNAAITAAFSVITWAAFQVRTIIKAKTGFDLDVAMNDEMRYAIQRALEAAFARGISPGAAVDMVVRDILAKRPDTVKRFKLDTAKGGEALRSIVSDTAAIKGGWIADDASAQGWRTATVRPSPVFADARDLTPAAPVDPVQHVQV